MSDQKFPNYKEGRSEKKLIWDKNLPVKKQIMSMADFSL